MNAARHESHGPIGCRFELSLDKTAIPADTSFDNLRRYARHDTVAFFEGLGDQRTGSHHAFWMQNRTLEYLHVTANPNPVSDTHTARVIEPPAAFHVDDRMLVAGTDQNVSGKHAIVTDIDARGLVNQQVCTFHRGISANANVLPACVAQIDLARADARTRADLDQIVLAIKANLAVRDLHTLAKHQAVVAPSQLDRDHFHPPCGTGRNLNMVAGLDPEPILVAKVAQYEADFFQHELSPLPESSRRWRWSSCLPPAPALALRRHRRARYRRRLRPRCRSRRP